MRDSNLLRTVYFWSVFWTLVAPSIATSQDESRTPSQDKAPLDAVVIPMDLTGATTALEHHDLDDNGSLSKVELERFGIKFNDVKRYDLNHTGDLQQFEYALKLATEREAAGIQQYDSFLRDKYMRQYDKNKDGKLSFEEMAKNTFTDELDTYDKNNDEQITSKELIHGLAWERRFRDELGIKGCDQGGAMKLLENGDKNGNRQLDEKEAATIGLESEVFRFDHNEDNTLTISELAECLASRRQTVGINPSDQFRIRAILRRRDKDCDGAISSDEMLPEEANSESSKCDYDEDGMVTEAELERYFGLLRRELNYDDQDLKRAWVLIHRNVGPRGQSLTRQDLVASGGDRSSVLDPDKFPLIDKDKNSRIDVTELARYLKQTRERDQ